MPTQSLTEITSEIEKSVACLQALGLVLAAAERKRGPILHPVPDAQVPTPTDLPPSYAAFLNLHDGWAGFWKGFTLTGLDGRLTAHAAYDIRTRVCAEFAALYAATPSPRRRFVWTDHAIIGSDFKGGLLVLDHRTRDIHGEMRVLVVRRGGVVHGYETFAHLLRCAIEDLSTDVADLLRACDLRRAS